MLIYVLAFSILELILWNINNKNKFLFVKLASFYSLLILPKIVNIIKKFDKIH